MVWIALGIGGFMTYDGAQQLDDVVKPSGVIEVAIGIAILLFSAIAFFFGDN